MDEVNEFIDNRNALVILTTFPSSDGILPVNELEVKSLLGEGTVPQEE